MNEIEKMYSNAGIKCLHPSGFCRHIGAICEVCERHKYPPFTAEKQLKLIKWLLHHKQIDYLRMSYTEGEYCILDISIKCVTGYSYSNSDDDDFDIALASLINAIWQDLIKKEKQQIKEILE